MIWFESRPRMKRRASEDALVERLRVSTTALLPQVFRLALQQSFYVCSFMSHPISGVSWMWFELNNATRLSTDSRTDHIQSTMINRDN